MATSKVLSRRRRGVVIVYIALALVVLMGATGLAVDVGNMYRQRDNAQRAADAAALAGAVQLMGGASLATANTSALQVAAEDGYNTSAGATVTPTLNPDGLHPYWYKVYVAKPAPLFFLAVFGLRQATVGAPATATYQVPSSVNINGPVDYGTGSGPYTVSQFGPWAEHADGDCYDTMYLEDNTPNPLYKPTGTTNDPTGQGGFNYNITIPQNYASVNGTTKVSLDLFDPYNNASSPSSIDEIRAPQSGNPGNPNNKLGDGDITLFRLYPPVGSANANTPIATATCGSNGTTSGGSSNCGTSSSQSMTWITPTGFVFDISNYSSLFTGGSTPVNFRLNVETLSGSSENGYSLRAGPPLTGKQTFNQNNGTNITATGEIEINFDENGTALVYMGTVPAGSTSVSIMRFDTDVGAEAISYTDSNGNTYKSNFSATATNNDTFYTDTFNLGSNYPGGVWTVHYTAGATDTSDWNMSYVGPSNSNPGSVSLVQ